MQNEQEKENEEKKEEGGEVPKPAFMFFPILEPNILPGLEAQVQQAGCAINSHWQKLILPRPRLSRYLW